MVKILKTVDWENCKDVLLHFAKNKADQAIGGTPSNFCDFFAMFPTLIQQDMLQEISKRLMTEPFDDVTATSVADENSTLFIHGNSNEALALNIIVNHLLSDDHCVSWRYLDYQKNAVAKFCHSVEGDKAYLFCMSNHDASVLHLVNHRNQLIVVPVLFVTDLAGFQKNADTDLAHYGYLRDYLPRDIGDLLSKKKHHPKAEDDVNDERHVSGIDNGDML